MVVSFYLTYGLTEVVSLQLPLHCHLKEIVVGRHVEYLGPSCWIKIKLGPYCIPPPSSQGC